MICGHDGMKVHMIFNIVLLECRYTWMICGHDGMKVHMIFNIVLL